jgi:hypothetical protein
LDGAFTKALENISFLLLDIRLPHFSPPPESHVTLVPFYAGARASGMWPDFVVGIIRPEFHTVFLKEERNGKQLQAALSRRG